MVEKTTSYWIKKLTDIEMPILSAIVRQLSKLTGDDDTEINQLAEVILKDPHLTSQVLKIANSIQYNPSNTAINTVTRAIVLLGFQGVRSLCISLMVVDSLLGKKPRDRLLQTMAKAFYAAVLARTMYQKTNNTDHEEVFIAALLYNLGEMAFWAYGGQTADQLECVDNDSGSIAKELGTNFKTLSKELGKIWKLGPVLQEALSDNPAKNLAAQAVLLGDAYSQMNDLNEDEQLALIKKIASFTGQSFADTKHLIDETGKAATLVAVEFGAAKVCHLISGYKDVSEKKSPQTVTVLTANPSLQLSILRDLTHAALDVDFDVTTVFQMALEGMHRGVGLERVVLAFFHNDKVKLKFVLGENTEGWRDKFSFNIDNESENIFTDCIDKKQPVWLDKSYYQKHPSLISQDIKNLLGNKPAFMGVLKVNRRNAALFYADRGDTNEPLNKEHFESFKHFLHQSELTIQTMADRKQ